MAESLKADKHRKDFFISYNKNDAEWAEWIAWQLEDAGYSTLLMAWDFRPGTNFVAGMQKGTTVADRTIAVLSPDYLDSHFTKPEWYAAFAKDPTGEKGILLPIRVRECRPEGLLGPIIYIDLVDKKPEEAKEILLTGVELKRAKPKTEPGYPGGKKSKESEPRYPGALPPIWNVPQRRNPNFTGRQELLAQLHQLLNSGKHTALTQAISGLGGIGKTQLAVEYAHRHKADYKITWWIHAEDPAALVSELAALANPLDLREKGERDLRVQVQAVLLWLEQNKNWLLIFDNVPEPEKVKDYLPRGETGHIIITSRHQAWSGVASPLEVKVMPENEAVDFLLKQKDQTDRETAKKLAKVLGYFPLALEHVRAYIEGVGITLSDYYELYTKQGSELRQDQKAPIDYEHTVATTWEISFTAVHEESPAATDLLNLCAFLAPDDIPLDIIRDGAEHLPESLADTAKDQVAFNKTIGALLRYSLIKKDKDKDTISIHRLVQAVIRDRLAEDEKNIWAAAAVKIVNEAYPQESDDVRTWTDCERLLSHAQATTAYIEKLRIANEATAYLLNSFAVYIHGRASFAEAKAAFQQSLKICKKVYGEEHPEVAIRLNNIGMVLKYLGDLTGAKKYYERALKIDEENYGKNHPNVARDIGNLGTTLLALGDSVEAKKCFERALKINESIYGKNHPNVAIDVNNLGATLNDLGDFAGAKKYYARALEIEEVTYGKNHPNVARCINNLGSVLWNLRDFPGAKKNFERALAIFIEFLGEDHPDTKAARQHLESVEKEINKQ